MRGPGRWPPALGAVAGQATLALGSFVLQLVAARSLGPGQFGVFALLFGAIVMATAVSSGLVGDSLTVLDRRDPVLRSALARTAGVAVALAAATALAAGLATGLGVTVAVALAAATAAFVTADLGRRLLMATLRFWPLVLADALGFTAAMAVVGAAAASGAVGLAEVLAAVAAGQVTALLVSVALLPAAERARPAAHAGGLRRVIAFGGWRAVQQLVRPTTLNVARWLVLVAAGATAVGELEAARLVVAPAMLAVQGIGSYLFASYAADRDRPAARLLLRADRAATVMLVGAAATTVVAAAALPLVGPLLAPGYDLAVLAVLGWGCYAASCAAVLPYGSLAAVRGRQSAVLGLRAADAAVGLAAVAVAVVALGAPAGVAPWLLAGGSFLGGFLCRQVLLVPLTRPAPLARRSPAEVPA